MNPSPQRPKTRLTAYSGQFWVWAAYRQAELSGSLMHLHDKRGYRFHSTLEMVKLIDLCLDGIGAAEAGFKPRRWAMNEVKEGDVPLNTQGTPVTPAGGPTFVIKVERRQNATWQGVVQWLDGKRQQRFRSVLELIYLLEDVVSQAPIPADDVLTWDESSDMTPEE